MSAHVLYTYFMVKFDKEISGIHTIAVAKGPEIYETLGDTFSEVFN